MRQRYNQTLETMNATVVEQVENDAGGDSSNMDEGKIWPFLTSFWPENSLMTSSDIVVAEDPLVNIICLHT